MVKNIQSKMVMLAAAMVLALPVHAAINIQQWQAKSGAKVLFVENHSLPIVDISVTFPAGSAYDAPAKSGTANLTRGLMSLGAGGLNEETISKSMADIGAQQSGSLDDDSASFKLRTLSSDKEQNSALAIFGKILQQPEFPAAVLNREKTRVIAALQEATTQPESLADKAFSKALYGAHPYAMRSSGEVDTVDKISRDDLQAFYQAHYAANGAVVALIGDINRARAEQIAESLTAQLPKTNAVGTIPAVALPMAPVSENIAHPASQSHILLGYPGVKRGDADYFALYVGNYILGGGGFVSRLTEEVREKRGLVYSVYSYFMPMKELGPFQIGLQTKREQSADALALVREVLKKFIAGGVTEAELKAAKQNITGGFPLRIDSNAKIIDYLAVIGFYNLPLNYLDTFNDNINAVTAAQIKDAFARRIKPDNMVTVVVAGGDKPAK